MEVTNAQLYWDTTADQPGWVLRYQVDGTEASDLIDGEPDDSTEALAARIADALSAHGQTRVRMAEQSDRRHGRRCVVEGGAVIQSWEA